MSMWNFIKTWLPRLIIAAALIYLGVQIYFVQREAIPYELRGLRFPYALDYGEGQVLDQINRLAHFQPIYFTSRSTGAPPYTIANYPPLYQLIQAPFVWVFGPALWYGRLISLLGVWAGAVCIALILHTLTTSWTAGIIGGLTTLCMPHVFIWSPFVRVDQLAFGLSLAGLFVVVRWPEGRGALITAAVLLVAAAYTKQSYALSAPLAAFAWLLSQRRFKRAFQLAGLVAGAGALIFGLLMLVTRGSFFFNIITATQTKFVWKTVNRNYEELLRRLPLLMYGCATFIAIGLWGRIRPKAWVLASAYLVGAAVEAITIGKAGSSINYFYELAAAFGLIAGAYIAWSMSVLTELTNGLADLASVLGKLARVRTWFTRFRARAAHVLAWKNFAWFSAIFMVLLATQITRMNDWYNENFREGNNYKYEHLAEVARLAEIVRGANGPVLADEYMALIPLAGQTVYMQPFEFKQLVDNGIWDDQMLASDIRSKAFATILIYHTRWWDSFSERWTPLLRYEIIANYEVTGNFAETDVYTPKK